jgi:DNA-binding NtrC family response regulator
LGQHGYTVLEAEDVDDALRLCREHGGEIHLLLTDVVMPIMSGRELAERAADIRPELKVLYMSGYTDNVVVHHGVKAHEAQFLQKPFTPRLLARKVREVLDRRE